MDNSLSAAPSQFALVYLSNILLFLRSAPQHTDNVNHVVMLLSGARVKLKLKMCKFFTVAVDYLGHVISRRPIGITSPITDAIKTLKARQSATDLKTFFGFPNDLRRFEPIFSRIEVQISNKLPEDEPFNLDPNDAELKEMKILQEKLISLPIFA